MYKYPIIDLHATWLVINPIQGCPNRCKYCFLNGVGLTKSKPVELASASEAVEMLIESSLYNEEIPICIESQTDAFATPANIKFVTDILKEMDKHNVMNPKIFITKCTVPRDFIELVDYYKKKGHEFIFFLSYSGLDRDIEIGIDKEKIKQNFITLNEYNMNIVHYWRPFVPQNSSKEKILEVANFVKKYAKCSVAIGVKVQDTFIDKIDFWPELLEEKSATTSESVWSKQAYDYIWGKESIIEKEYPIFQTTSCAIAYVLKTCDRNAFFDSEVCKKFNRCPKEQRDICKKYYENVEYVSEQYVYSLLSKLNLLYKENEAKIVINHNNRTIEIDGVELTMKDFTYLTQVTRYKIRAKKEKCDYYWNTSVNDADKLFI